MVRLAPHSELKRFYASLSDKNLPRTLPDHGIIETGVMVPSERILRCLRAWESECSRSEVLFFDLEHTAEDPPRALYVNLSELTEQELDAIITWWSAFALAPVDNSWALYRDPDHQVHFAGPDGLYDRLPE